MISVSSELNVVDVFSGEGGRGDFEVVVFICSETPLLSIVGPDHWLVCGLGKRLDTDASDDVLLACVAAEWESFSACCRTEVADFVGVT
jgi:hypothetical protein